METRVRCLYDAVASGKRPPPRPRRLPFMPCARAPLLPRSFQNYLTVRYRKFRPFLAQILGRSPEGAHPHWLSLRDSHQRFRMGAARAGGKSMACGRRMHMPQGSPLRSRGAALRRFLCAIVGLSRQHGISASDAWTQRYAPDYVDQCIGVSLEGARGLDAAWPQCVPAMPRAPITLADGPCLQALLASGNALCGVLSP